jgi:tRNA-specific 2-thiouridylase
MKNKMKKIAVGLSGGVDSSVAAFLLKQKGHDVIGIAMEIYNGLDCADKDVRHGCYGPGEKEDMETAASFCRELDIPFTVIDLKHEYQKYVLDYFRKEYLKGRTPNPCVVCNRHLKFGFLLEKAKALGISFQYFATGHYARIIRTGKHVLLRKASDVIKDQTYFLYGLTVEQLSQTLFPLGEMTKKEVRALARRHGLITANRPESQDFISGEGYSSLFQSDRLKKGDVVDEIGNSLGRHRGIIHYTVGQRRGLGISSPTPLYVKKIIADKNLIVVSNRDHLFSKGLVVCKLNIIVTDEIETPYKAKVKIRANHTAVLAMVYPDGRDKAIIIFNDPQMSISPGQSAVLYNGDIVIGGGIIEHAL